MNTHRTTRPDNRAARHLRAAGPFAVGLCAAMLCAAAAPALADGDPTTDGVPRLLPYQGMLELDGRPVEATGEDALHLQFSLYDGADAEQPVYSQPLVVEVYAGRFTATIGPTGTGPDGADVPIEAVISAADDLYLGMTLLGDPADPADDIPLSNRQRIYASPYAMWTTSATNLSVAGQARIGGDLVVDGALRVGGAVELPAGSLDIDDLHPDIIGQGLMRLGNTLTVDRASLQGEIRSWVRSHCRVQLGWRNSCRDCDIAPTKHVTVGADGTCISSFGAFARCLSDNTWGVYSPDGELNNNDAFYIRMDCD